ncbi:MAG: hypothetical protein HYV96_06030 [Opitutae bacterium]|nr:hypothetical protein [Opitutae bacterium]
MSLPRSRLLRRLLACASLALAAAPLRAEDASLQQLLEQNRQLLEQVKAQQKQIDDLRARLDRVEDRSATAPSASRRASAGERDRSIRLSGEASFGFFRSGADGWAPNSDFRVDDARVFLEAPVWRNVYFFGSVEITTREASDEYFHAGEIYLDVENLWTAGRAATLSLRAGRFNLPFGEEYQVRNVIDNPLVTHSLADIWGIDEGVQLYGALGRVRYNLAVQNGGHKTLRDFDPDKAVIARLALDATPRLTLSASAMRTGDLNVANDVLSEVWFANAFFRALGPAATTRTFAAQLAELDAAYRWRTGHLKAAYGWASFDDDSTTADFSRDLTFYRLEARQQLGSPLFAAARYSAIDAPGGYPLAGLGAAGKYFYNPFAPLTRDLHRLSLGLGYRFADPLVWKFEYTFEHGRLVNGAKRADEDMLSTLLGIRF